jgi:hypothetical protein
LHSHPNLGRLVARVSAHLFGRTLVAQLPQRVRVGALNVSVAGCKIKLFDRDTFQAYAATAQPWMTRIITE